MGCVWRGLSCVELVTREARERSRRRKIRTEMGERERER